MTGFTQRYGWPYPGRLDGPSPDQTRDLAEAVEATLATIDARIDEADAALQDSIDLVDGRVDTVEATLATIPINQLRSRVATTVAVTDSGTFTTAETLMDSVTASLVAGRVYQVRWFGGVASTTTDSIVLVRLREDSLSGNLLNERNYPIPTGSGGGVGIPMEAEFTAASTGSKTFVIAGLRNGGTGSLHADGSPNRTRYFYVDRVR